MDIDSQINSNDTIVDFKCHSHSFYSSKSYWNSNEIIIPVHQQDVYTLPNNIFILIKDNITKADGTAEDGNTSSINNEFAFMFKEIRYELCAAE